MKKLSSLILIITLITFVSSFAQTSESPVKWETKVTKISDNEYELTATAAIEDDWHIYASDLPNDDAIPTTIFLDSNEQYVREGKIKEEGNVSKSSNLSGESKLFNNKVSFTQKIKLKANEKNIKITGVVEYMVCSKNVCLPPKESNLTFKINS